MKAWLRALGRELGVLVRTFLAAWVALALVSVLYGFIADNPTFETAGEYVVNYSLLYVVSLFYLFWPAVIVAVGRLTYRMLGWLGLVPVPLILLGCAGTLFLGIDWLLYLFVDVLSRPDFEGAACGAPGRDVVMGVLCFASTALSPHGLWAMFKLALALLVLLVTGSLPGLVLAIVVIVRAVREKLGARASPAQG